MSSNFILSVYEFGKQLLDNNDLDPVYIVLHEAQLDQDKLRRWLLAYWCFYHTGTASWIADAPEVTVGSESMYWGRMLQAAGSKYYPRAKERRHFRAQNAMNSVNWLSKKGLQKLYAPITIPDKVYQLGTIMSYVGTWVGFGPWISFKVADMLERLGLADISFSTGAAAMFDSPRAAAKMMWELEGQPPAPSGLIDWAVSSILGHLGGPQSNSHNIGGSLPASATPDAVAARVERISGYLAPPRYERPVNVQEAETILCKWKSYRSGHYHIGEDIAALRAGLLAFAKQPTAQRLLVAGKKGDIW